MRWQWQWHAGGHGACLELRDRARQRRERSSCPTRVASCDRAGVSHMVHVANHPGENWHQRGDAGDPAGSRVALAEHAVRACAHLGVLRSTRASVQSRAPCPPPAARSTRAASQATRAPCSARGGRAAGRWSGRCGAARPQRRPGPPSVGRHAGERQSFAKVLSSSSSI